MPVFSVSTIKKPKQGASSSSAYSIYQRELGFLDVKYKDPFTKKITSDKYFEEKGKLMEEALNNPAITAAKKNDILVDYAKVQKDGAAWAITSNKTYKQTTDDLKSVLEDNWQSLWKNTEIMRTGNIPAMAAGMVDGEGGINDLIGQLEEIKSVMEEVPGSDDAVIPLQKNIDFLEDRAEFWRGVAMKPTEYAAIADTTADGAIKNFEIRNIANTSGYKNTGADMGGFALYGKPHPSLTDEDGTEKIVIGNNVFSDTGDGFYADGDFDMASLKNVTFGNYYPGTVFKSPNGSFRVMQEDGSFTNYQNEKDLRLDEFSPDGAVAMTTDEFSDLDFMYDVKEAEVVDVIADIRKNFLAEYQARIDGLKDKKYTPDPNLMVQTSGKTEGDPLDRPFKLSTDDTYPVGNRQPTKKPNENKGGFLDTIANFFKGKNKTGGRATEDSVNTDKPYKILGGQ